MEIDFHIVEEDGKYWIERNCHRVLIRPVNDEKEVLDGEWVLSDNKKTLSRHFSDGEPITRSKVVMFGIEEMEENGIRNIDSELVMDVNKENVIGRFDVFVDSIDFFNSELVGVE